MKKLLTKTLLVAVCLLVGVNSAWADTYTNEAATITWAFTSHEDLTSTNFPADAFLSTNFSKGTNLQDPTTFNTKNCNAGWAEQTLVYFKPVTKVDKNAADAAENMLEWTITPATGITFTPENVSVTACTAGGTGDPQLTIYAVYSDNTIETVQSRTNPRRPDKTDQGDGPSVYTKTLENAKKGAFKVRIYLAGLTNTAKGMALTNIVVTGKVSGTPVATTTYTITAATNNPTYGTAVADASSLDENETTEITAYPNAGYQFVSWSVQGEGSTLSSTTDNPTTLTMGTSNTTVTATFSAINYAITHGVATGGTYTISVAGGEAVSTSTTATVGQTITLAGTPTDPANTYVKWNVTDADNNAVAVTNNQFTMPAKAVTIAPVFTKPLNTLFSMTNITGITNSEENSSIGSVSATISEGGAVEVFNNKGAAAGLLYNSNSINLNGSGGNYIHITFPTKLVAGDEISATFLADDQDWKISKTTSGAAAKTNPYTLTENDAFIGATELYFFKNSGAQITELYVKGVGQLSDLEVTSSATPTVAIDETSNIEISTSSTGAVTYTSSDTDVATVSATGVITGVDGGEATITIEQAADANYRAGVKTITVTVPSVDLIKVKLLGGTSAKVSGTVGGTADVNTQTDKKFGSSGHYAGFTLANNETLHTGDVINVKITQASGNGTITIYDSDKSTVLYDTQTLGVVGDNKFVLPEKVDGKSTIYICRTSENKWNAYVDFISVTRPDASITLNASGFSTYSAGSDFTVVGATAYKMALNVSEGTMTGAAIDGKIPAGAGVLLKGEAGAIVSILNTKDAEALTGNSLLGTTDANGNTVAVPEGSIYVLKGDTFKPYTGTTFASNKAFFQLDKVDESRTFTMIFEDGETTGVGLIDNGKLTIDNEAGAWYSIQGVRHDGKPTRSGFYIFNGKKVVIK